MVSKVFQDTADRLRAKALDESTDYLRHWAKKGTEELTELTTRQKGVYKLGTKATATAGLFIAGTAVADAAMKKADKFEAHQMNKKMEKNLERKAKEEERRRKEYRHGVSFGHADMGEVVMDMFKERTGHHKMGNSRF